MYKRQGTFSVETPAFMPVGTYGTVKGMTPEEVRATGAEILLGNTFHLWLRPGQEVMRKHGDLHDFMQWHRPVSYTHLDVYKRQAFTLRITH